MYKLLKTCGRAKRGEFHTPHGVIQTPVFMNVGTIAAIKGALSTEDLERVKCQVELSNTYHLHVRPGDELSLIHIFQFVVPKGKYATGCWRIIGRGVIGSELFEYIA